MDTTKNGHKLDYNIEFMRVIACIMVVFIHVSNYYCRGYSDISRASYLFSTIINGLCRVSVPIFFMISGALLLEQNINLQKNWKHLYSIVSSLIGWSIIYYFWNGFYLDRQYSLNDLFYAPVKKHLWFLYALIGLYITIPFWQCMVKSMTGKLVKYFVFLWLLLSSISYYCAFFELDITYPIPLIGTSCYLGYFILGYLIHHHLKRISFSIKKAYALAVSVTILTVLLTIRYTFSQGYHEERFFEYRNTLIAIASVSLFYAVLKGKRFFFGGKIQAAIQLISKHSFTIYLVHILFLDVVKHQLYPKNIDAWFGIPLFVTGIFFASLLFSFLLENVRTLHQSIFQKIMPAKKLQTFCRKKAIFRHRFNL